MFSFDISQLISSSQFLVLISINELQVLASEIKGNQVISKDGQHRRGYEIQESLQSNIKIVNEIPFDLTFFLFFRIIKKIF